MQLLDSGRLSIFNDDLSSLYTDFTGTKIDAKKSHELTEKITKKEKIRFTGKALGLENGMSFSLSLRI